MISVLRLGIQIHVIRSKSVFTQILWSFAWLRGKTEPIIYSFCYGADEKSGKRWLHMHWIYILCTAWKILSFYSSSSSEQGEDVLREVFFLRKRHINVECYISWLVGKTEHGKTHSWVDDTLCLQLLLFLTIFTLSCYSVDRMCCAFRLCLNINSETQDRW